jgi:type IV pilus assembly protein PilC
VPTGSARPEEAVADSEDALRADLAKRGLLVQSVREKRSRMGLRAARVSPEEFALFNQEFMALIRAGLTVPDALALAAKRPDSPALGQMLARVLHDVQNGALLSEACARHPEAFERLYVAALRTGEKTGDLFLVLGRYHEYLSTASRCARSWRRRLPIPCSCWSRWGDPRGAVRFRDAALRRDVRRPRHAACRSPRGADGAGRARPFRGAARHRRGGGRGVAGALDFDRGRAPQVDQIKEGSAVSGELQRIVSGAAQLARSLSTLLAGGTPLVDALRTAGGSLSNQLHLDRLEAATQRVIGGESLNRAVRATRLMPETAARMVEVGEASGGLDTMLAEVAQFYEDILDARLARSMAWLGRRIGPRFLLPYLLEEEGREVKSYLDLYREAPSGVTGPTALNLAVESKGHADRLAGWSGWRSGPGTRPWRGDSSATWCTASMMALPPISVWWRSWSGPRRRWAAASPTRWWLRDSPGWWPTPSRWGPRAISPPRAKRKCTITKLRWSGKKSG